MERFLHRLFGMFFHNDCRYVEVFLEEFGRGKCFSMCKVLIRSFDPGVRGNIVEEIVKELKKVGGREVCFVSHYVQDHDLIISEQDQIFVGQVGNIKEYGTSVSFEIVSGTGFAEDVYGMLSQQQLMYNLNIDFTATSQFRDLTSLSFGFSDFKIDSRDYPSLILSSLKKLVSSSPPNVQEAVKNM